MGRTPLSYPPGYVIARNLVSNSTLLAPDAFLHQIEEIVGLIAECDEVGGLYAAFSLSTLSPM